MSAILGFNPIAAAVSFIKGLQDNASWLYDRKVDTVGLLTDDDGNPTEVTGYQTDGSAAIQYSVSVGSGRGSAKVDLTGDQLAGVAAALKAFDPEDDRSSLTPAECIERTIAVDKDGETTFKLSLAKNSRQVKIPAGQWAGYVGLMQANADSVEAAVTHYRNLSEAAEAEANK